MQDTYRAVLIGCSRMGAFIDHEIGDREYILRPYSHAASYRACERTQLVACSDLRPDVMAEVGRQYGISPEKQYLDYRRMIDAERPDIVSIATQPEGRAEIAVHAAEHGARAIYCEKAMAASLAEAQAMVDACERHGVVFNLGTQRRWHPGFRTMRDVIGGGRLGALLSVIIQETAVFDGASHYFDNLLFLNGDRRASWVQMQLRDGDWTLEGDRLTGDPAAHGGIGFENGVVAYSVPSAQDVAFEARCADGTVRCTQQHGYSMRRRVQPGTPRSPFADVPFPEWQPVSANLRLVQDLVRSLDTGESPAGGVRVAYAATELTFAAIESHLRGGARVDLPLTGSTVRLHRDRAPRQPRFQPLQ